MYSTLQQLLLFYHQIICKSSSCHDQCDIVYLDICEAFDTISQSELMSKLYNLYRCTWKLMALVALLPKSVYVWLMQSQLPLLSCRGYLRGACFGNFCSWHTSVTCLIMFLHFCICMLNGINCARSISSNEDGGILQANLNSLCTWARQWKIGFKVFKCMVLHCKIGKMYVLHVNSEFELNLVLVKMLDTYVHMNKDLGVFFSADLSFTTHLNYITSRVYCMLLLIRWTSTTRNNVQ